MPGSCSTPPNGPRRPVRIARSISRNANAASERGALTAWVSTHLQNLELGAAGESAAVAEPGGEPVGVVLGQVAAGVDVLDHRFTGDVGDEGDEFGVVARLRPPSAIRPARSARVAAPLPKIERRKAAASGEPAVSTFYAPRCTQKRRDLRPPQIAATLKFDLELLDFLFLG